MFDVQSFLERLGMKKADLCRELEMDPKSSLLSSYEKGRSNPSYEVCEKLIGKGVTAQELFGEELGSKLIANSSVPVSSAEELSPEMQKMLNHPDFIAGMKKAFSEIESKKENK